MRDFERQLLDIGPDRYSPLLQAFSMMFCCEQAFRAGADAFETIFCQKLSVDALESTSRRMGYQAAEFLASLPDPPACEEGELLVLSVDGKGVPMVRECPKAKADRCHVSRRDFGLMRKSDYTLHCTLCGLAITGERFEC